MAKGAKIERTLPQDLDAEAGLLGCMLHDTSAVALAARLVRYHYFYRTANQIVFRAAQRLMTDGDAVDELTVRTFLRKHKCLDKVGGTEYLQGLATAVPSSANIEHYAKIVSDCARKRRIIEVATALHRKAYDSLPAEELQAAAERALRTIDAPAEEYVETEELLMSSPGESRISTELVDLDHATGGGLKIGLNLITGMPGSGKTTLGLQLVRQLAADGVPCALYSADQHMPELAWNMWSAYTKLPIEALQKNPKAIEVVTRLPISWYKGQFNLESILGTMRLRHARGDRAFLVDYLGLVQVPGPEPVAQKKEQVAERLKLLAQELEVPIILISKTPKTHGQKPTLDHVEGGAGVAFAADQVWWLEKKDSAYGGEAYPVTIIVLKNRQGPTGRAQLILQGPVHRFYCEADGVTT